MKVFALMFVLGLVISVPLAILVYGKAPYWVDDYITYKWEGLTPSQSVALAAVMIIVPLSIDALLKLLRRLRG